MAEEFVLLAEVLHPFPLSAVGSFAAAHATHSGTNRVECAVHALTAQGHQQVTAAAIEFCYRKFEDVLPDYLPPSMASMAIPRPIIEPSFNRCAQCDKEFDLHRRNIPLKLYSARDGFLQGVALERHCNGCDAYFIGHWQYQRKCT